MKRVLLTLTVLGAIILSGCEKEEALVPVEKTSLKAKDAIMCAGCGQWDITDPDPEPSAARTANYDGATDTVAAPAKPVKPIKKK